MRLRPATSSDVANIARLLHANRDDVSLFQQSPADILRNLDGFVVADRDGSVVGCACIHRYHADLVEIFSVRVDPTHQGQGLGTSLMNALLQAEKRARTVWLSTAKPDYFARFGFRPMSRWRLPIGVLLHKLRLVFAQPVERWFPAVFGGHSFRLLDDGLVRIELTCSLARGAGRKRRSDSCWMREWSWSLRPSPGCAARSC